MRDQIQGTTMKIETGEANSDHSHTFENIAAQSIAIHMEAALDCSTGIDAATRETAHNDLAQPTKDTATDLAMTHHANHIADFPT